MGKRDNLRYGTVMNGEGWREGHCDRNTGPGMELVGSKSGEWMKRIRPQSHC